MDYTTLLSTRGSTCAREVNQNADKSYTEYVYDYTGDDEVTQELEAKDTHTTAAFSVAYNADREIKGLRFFEGSPHFWIEHQKGRGSVVVYPTHPRYDDFPFPEVEVEPAPSEDEKILGKVIASWDVTEVFSDLPF